MAHQRCFWCWDVHEVQSQSSPWSRRGLLNITKVVLFPMNVPQYVSWVIVVLLFPILMDDSYLYWHHWGYIGLAFMVLSLVGIMWSFWMPAGHRAGWVALISCFSFRVAFSVSLGPLPYIITAEVFPASGWPIQRSCWLSIPQKNMERGSPKTGCCWNPMV